MKSPTEGTIEEFVDCAASAATLLGAENIARDVLRATIEGILLGQKDVWGVLNDGLITAEEARNLVLAGLELWLRTHYAIPRRGGQWWTTELERAIDGVFVRARTGSPDRS